MFMVAPPLALEPIVNVTFGGEAVSVLCADALIVYRSAEES